MPYPKKGGRGSYASPKNRTRINNYIRATSVRLIDDKGEQLGIKTTQEALAIAKEERDQTLEM